MRHKMRPMKTSRHKSVTILSDNPQTSFQDSSSLVASAQRLKKFEHETSTGRSVIGSMPSYPESKSEFFEDIEDMEDEPEDNGPGAYDHYDDDNYHQMMDRAQNYGDYIIGTYDDEADDDGSVLNLNLRIKINNNNRNHAHQSTYNLKGANTNTGAINLKQFQHVRHMSDIMRLAFFENNDISPEVWGSIDFNSSTASILKRNIQQQFNRNTTTDNTTSTPKLDIKVLRSASKSVQQKNINNSNNIINKNSNVIMNNQQHVHNTSNNINNHRNITSSQSVHLESQQQEQRSRPDSSTTQLLTPKKARISALHSQATQQRPQRQQQNLDQPLKEQEPATQQKSGSVNKVSVTKREASSGEFPCDEPGCGKFFPSLRKLRHHKVVHSDEFPYHCQFEGCDKKFKRKFGIDLHSTTHFDLETEMYDRTSNKSSMQIFGRRMQYSMCKQCDAKFKTVHEFQVHMLAHGKEPFKCPVKGCGQSFSIWKSFQKHRASHYFNYHCKMSPDCDHQTSNLQMLKLHIYCCHFNRKLPDNARPTSHN